MEENKQLEVVTEVAKASQSFLELAQNMLSPLVSRWHTAAELHDVEAKIRFAQNHPEVVFAIREDGTPGFVNSYQQEIAIRAANRILADAERQQSNLEQVYMHAADEIEDINKVADTPIDADWITRFNTITQDVSDEEIQFIWGKILAGEFQHVGSFSLRTLEVIKNLDRKDAQLIEKVSPFVFSQNKTSFICSEDGLLEEFGITYSNILDLDECGFLNTSEEKQLTFHIEPETKTPYYTKRHAVIFTNEKKEQLSVDLKGYPVSQAGRELLRILDAAQNESYVLKHAKKLQSKYKNLKISVHKILSWDGDIMGYDDVPEEGE